MVRPFQSVGTVISRSYQAAFSALRSKDDHSPPWPGTSTLRCSRHDEGTEIQPQPWLGAAWSLTATGAKRQAPSSAISPRSGEVATALVSLQRGAPAGG